MVRSYEIIESYIGKDLGCIYIQGNYGVRKYPIRLYHEIFFLKGHLTFSRRSYPSGPSTTRAHRLHQVESGMG